MKSTFDDTLLGTAPAGARHLPESGRSRRFCNRPNAPTYFPGITDFSPLKGCRVLTVVDEDNIRISMQQHRQPLSYRRLLARLHSETNRVFPLAVLTAPEGDQRRVAYLKSRGWNVLAIPRETVLTTAGPQLKANADFDLAFELGHLVNTGQFDTVLLGTGDGDLAVAIGRGIRRRCPQLHLFTLSVPGSASGRLRSRSDLFDGNIVVGRDLSRKLDLRN